MSDQMVIMTDDQYLEDGQAIKTLIVNKMIAGGVPDSEERVELLLKVLDSRDKVALGRKRIDVEANVGSQAAAATALIADLFKNINSGDTPYVLDKPIDREAPRLPAHIPTPTLVTDETAVAAEQLSYDQFVSADDLGSVEEEKN